MKGEGTTTSPYELDSKEDLKWFRDYVNEGHPEACAKLTDNINLNPGFTFNEEGYTGSGTPEEWEPIGEITNSFQGIFDGDGFTISGLYINSTDTYARSGLFHTMGRISTSGFSITYERAGLIKDLTVEGFISTKGQGHAGGICCTNGGTIQNCTNKVIIVGNNEREQDSSIGSLYVGGICSTNETSGIIQGCVNEGAISCEDYVGGIVASNSGTIEKCYNKGAISGINSPSFTGGICSWILMNGGIINNCYNIGTLHSKGGNVGGIGVFNGEPISSPISFKLLFSQF